MGREDGVDFLSFWLWDYLPLVEMLLMVDKVLSREAMFELRP